MVTNDFPQNKQIQTSIDSDFTPKPKKQNLKYVKTVKKEVENKYPQI